MTKQLTREEIRNAKAIHLYDGDTIYVELESTEDVYGSYKGGEWYIKGNFWDYFETSLMLCYFENLTPEKAFELMDKWKQEEIENNNRLSEAIIFATEIHRGQFRKGTSIPYIVHPMEVLQILYSMRADTNLMIAGVLHDIVEDTDTTLDEIREKFGDDVADLVASNSEDKSKTWQERKEHTIKELANADISVKILIMADKVANIRSIATDYANIGDKLWERFNAPKEKQAWYYCGIQDALYELQDTPKCEKIYWEFVGLYKDVFVKFYWDEENNVIYQKDENGEVYYFCKENPVWISCTEELSKDIARNMVLGEDTRKFYSTQFVPENATILSRKDAEFLEDVWASNLLNS